VIDSQLRNTLAHGFDIARVASGQAFYPDLNTRTGLKITKVIDPPGIDFRLANFDHQEL